jgi:hypothetical protein
MKNFILSLVAMFTFSMAFAGGGYLLVKAEGDLGQARGELYEMFDNALVGFSHETNEFVIECGGKCDTMIKQLKEKSGYKVKEISEEEFKKIMNR